MKFLKQNLVQQQDLTEEKFGLVILMSMKTFMVLAILLILNKVLQQVAGIKTVYNKGI
jgi:hypothetical protein